MIVIREKSFGQVKRENKAKKKAWEVQRGKDKIREDFKRFAGVVGIDPNDKENLLVYAKDTINNSGGSIIRDRNIKNSFDSDKISNLPEITKEDAAKRLGRRFNLETIKEDDLSKKAEMSTWNSNWKEDYYKDKIDRRKFDKLKGKSKKDLMDLMLRDKDIISVEEKKVQESSTPMVKKVRRFFKKNINRLIRK